MASHLDALGTAAGSPWFSCRMLRVDASGLRLEVLAFLCLGKLHRFSSSASASACRRRVRGARLGDFERGSSALASNATSISAHASRARLLFSSTRAGHERLRLIARRRRYAFDLRNPSEPTSNAMMSVPRIRSSSSLQSDWSSGVGTSAVRECTIS